MIMIKSIKPLNVSLGFRAVSRLCYVLRGIYSLHRLYQHFLAHSWTFLSASGQGAKPNQEFHIEEVLSGYLTAATLGTGGLNIHNYDGVGQTIPYEDVTLVDNCKLS
jgi:hypothetical protein